MNRTLSLLLGLMLLIAAPTTTFAQNGGEMAYDTSKVVPPPEARPSPMRVAATMFDNGTYAKVMYGSPMQRGRTLFSEGGDALVPYGEVWRLGANEATEITVTDAVQFGDQTLEAGTYTLFAIPGPQTWTILVNSGLGQWGAYRHNKDLDLFSVEAPVTAPSKGYEAFTIAFEDQDDGSKHLAMMWGDAKVAVPVTAR